MIEVVPQLYDHTLIVQHISVINIRSSSIVVDLNKNKRRLLEIIYQLDVETAGKFFDEVRKISLLMKSSHIILAKLENQSKNTRKEMFWLNVLEIVSS